MNIIQRALKLQGIDAAWLGPEPSDPNEITSDYLNATVSGGLPRMIRSVGDGGSNVNIVQLRLDYNNLLNAVTEERRIAAIKAKANDVITAEFPDWKQRNLTARAMEIINAAKDRNYTVEEQEELDEIEAIWSWIKLVRAASDAAEIEHKQVYQVVWPVWNG